MKEILLRATIRHSSTSLEPQCTFILHRHPRAIILALPMDDLLVAVRTTLVAVLDLAPRLPPARQDSNNSALVLPGAQAHDRVQGRSCVDLLLRLLCGCGATEKRINSLPIVTLRRAPRKSCGQSDGEDHDSGDQLDAYEDPTLMFDQDTCSICLDSYEANSTVRVLGCCHVYHAKCVGEWLRRRPTCPMCNLTAC